MNIANQLTLSRIILTFIFMFFVFSQGIVFKILALFTFTIASLTDLYDGRIARKKNLISDFGKLMDPIADKILILSAFLAFVQIQIIPAWMAVLIFTREILITGVRLFAITKGRYLASTKEGKHKTASQMVAIFLILGFLISKDLFRKFWIWTDGMEIWSNIGVFILMSLTVILTLISGISYLWRNRYLIAIEKSN